MRWLLVTALLLSCGTRPEPFCSAPCGLSIGATNRVLELSCDEYTRTVSAVLEDPKMPSGACASMRGAVAWEVPGFSSRLGDFQVAGWTECHNTRVFFHTGDGYLLPGDLLKTRHAWDTAFAHELVHLAQNCEAPLPVDEGADVSHANWIRDDLYDLPTRVRERLK